MAGGAGAALQDVNQQALDRDASRAQCMVGVWRRQHERGVCSAAMLTWCDTVVSKQMLRIFVRRVQRVAARCNSCESMAQTLHR